MADGLLTAQDIAIKSCKIIGSSGQSMEFKNLIIEFNYYEDIFATGISGSLLINDSMGYINIMQLQGYEVLILEIDKPGLEEPIKKDFRISNISNRMTTKGSNENYTINFCSEELLLNEQYKISKSYKNQTVTDIIKSICTEYLKIPEKKVEIDKTIGLRDIVLPNFKPIQAINWLATFAKSDDQKNIGSPFLFFEDRDGFKFKSMLTLFQQNVYRKYHYDVKGLNDPRNNMVMDFNKELVNVLQYEQIKSFDSITAVRSGAMSNKMHTVDPVRLKLGETTFNYDDYTQKMDAASLNKGSLPTSGANRFDETATQTPGVVKFCMTTTGQSENKYIKSKKITVNENRVEETVPLRTAQLALFCTNRLKLLIPGDVDMTVGRVIEFNLPQIAYNNANRQKENDEYFSGKYLVTAVRHVFNQENKFFTCIEICKESTPKAYDDFNNQKVAGYR